MSDRNKRCPQCGYTRLDVAIHGDHHLCSNSGFFDAPKEHEMSTKRYWPAAQNDILFVIYGDRPTSNDTPNHDADREPVVKVYDSGEYGQRVSDIIADALNRELVDGGG